MGRLEQFKKEYKTYKKIKRRRRIEMQKLKRPSEVSIVNGKSLSQEENVNIDKYFKNFKLKIDHFWHLKYKIVSGHFCYNYFPELFYNSDLKCLLNDPEYTKVYSNKFLLSQIIKGSGLSVKTPTNIVSCNNGILLDKNNEKISTETAKTILLSKDNMFVKKSVGTYGGVDCFLVEKNDEKIVDEILKSFGKNFLVQERIRNQSDISIFNPTTLNTFRIITYYVDDEIHTSPIVLRIGRKNAGFDNAHAGGMFVAVDDDGVIVSDAKNTKGLSFSVHPDSNIKFKGHRIENVLKIKKAAIKLAALFPQTRLIDWDLALDENGDVVCIEANIDSGSIWLIQMSHGKPVFGVNTDKMLEIVKNECLGKMAIRNLKRK